jgi:chorismate mutase
VLRIGRGQVELGQDYFDPAREARTLGYLVAENAGPFDVEILVRGFKKFFSASLELKASRPLPRALL